MDFMFYKCFDISHGFDQPNLSSYFEIHKKSPESLQWDTLL